MLPWQKLHRQGEPQPASEATAEMVTPAPNTPLPTSSTSEDEAPHGVVVVNDGRRRRSSVLLTESGRLLVAPDLPPEANPLSKLLSGTTSPAFEVEELVPLTNSQPLLCLMVYFSNSYFLVQSLELDMAVYQRFVMEVEATYRALPYHSSLHAADVVVNAMRLMKHSEAPLSLLPLEMLAILVACAGGWGECVCVCVCIAESSNCVWFVYVQCMTWITSA